MKEGQGSRTADRVAARRAAHQLLDAPLVFDDPIAIRLLDPSIAARLRAQPEEYNSSTPARYLRAALVVRSRAAEDALAEACARGISQYVILGAGFDTFAYRNPFPGLRVFEIDHPATQAVKRQRLADAGIGMPSNLAFVPVDFARDRLADALAAAGFDAGEPAFFSWLGVVLYLTRGAIEETLRYVAERPRGSTIVFDYAASPLLLSWRGRLAFRALAARLAAIGEPLVTVFMPDDLSAMLRGLGFSTVDDAGPADLNQRYFTGRTDGLRVGEMSHVVRAVV